MSKGHNPFRSSFTANEARRRSRPRLILVACIISIAAAVALVSSGIPGANASLPGSPGGQALQLSETAKQQIAALLEEKESRTAAQQKIDSQLLYALKANRGETIARGIPTLETDVRPDAVGTVLVDIKANVTESLLGQMKSMGADIVNSFAHDVRASLPLSRIEEFASLPDISFIRPAAQPITNNVTQSGALTTQGVSGISPSLISRMLPGFDGRASQVRSSVMKVLSAIQQQRGANRSIPAQQVVPTKVNTSEGDVAHSADQARTIFGINGSGVKVGVLSNGVDSLATLQASGDLPAGITVIAGQAGSGDEGSAMLEIVFDLAPGAQLFFATGGGGPANFANNIRLLRLAGCDIIVDDIFYIEESAFQDGQAPAVSSPTNGGAVAQAVNDVTTLGSLYFSPAGNAGNVTDGTAGCWEGDFNSGGTLAAVPGGNVHDFGGGNVGDPITAQGSPVFAASLFWSDPLGGSSNDYDLFVLDSTLTTVLASSTNTQSGTQDPYEEVPSSAIQVGRRMVILQETGAANRALHLNMNRGRLGIATTGQAKGHPSGAAAYSVAAVRSSTAGGGVFTGGAANPIETFSSDGLRRMILNADGSAIISGNVSFTGGVLRQKPDVTAADGVSCAAPGFNPFFGTSAAAPHAAAIAALVKSFMPALTPAQVRNALTSTALDIMAAGVDRDSGFGIVMAKQALASFCMITCPPNITQPNDPGQCGAVVTYPPPTAMSCGTAPPSCSPASGSFFPKGTTTVTCTTAAGPSCMFTVTVNDTENPTITCPADINAAAPASCPIATSAPAVTFTVTASDNCPGVTFVCKDQNNQVVTSGQPFPVGTTTVTCTATDASGNTASCSFNVNTFSFCLQDDTSAGNVVLVNAQTGDYFFCCGVPIASGRGTLTTRGCIGSIDHIKGNRKVHIEWDTAANSNAGAGTAFAQKPTSGSVVCQITDKNMSNNTCQCSGPPPPASPKKPPTERTL